MALTSAVALQKAPAEQIWGSAMAATGQIKPKGQARAEYVPAGQYVDATHDTHDCETKLKKVPAPQIPEVEWIARMRLLPRSAT